jgi:hypothetical protein
VRTVIAIWETEGIDIVVGQVVTSLPSVYVLDKEVRSACSRFSFVYFSLGPAYRLRSFLRSSFFVLRASFFLLTTSTQGLPLKGKTISGYQFNASNANLVGVPAESLYVHLFTEAPGCVDCPVSLACLIACAHAGATG